MTDAKLVKQLLDAFRKSQSKGTQGYDSQAVVKRVEGNTIWVHIPGGIDETPIRKTVSANVGDVIQIRVAGGRAFAVGNETSPPTDDTLAKAANQTAGKAKAVAEAAKIAVGNVEQVRQDKTLRHLAELLPLSVTKIFA